MSGDRIESLDPATYRETVRRAIAEDLGWGDVTTEATAPKRHAHHGADHLQD